jgi:hypothetical protein
MAQVEIVCADCGGWDVEWMRKCQKHGVEFCRGCSCPWCAEEDSDEYDDERYDEHRPTATDLL